MSEPPGWYPFQYEDGSTVGARPSDSWKDWNWKLGRYFGSEGRTFRRFWDGGSWTGNMVRNDDLMGGSHICESCGLPTVPTYLSQEEKSRYRNQFIQVVAFNIAKLIPGALAGPLGLSAASFAASADFYKNAGRDATTFKCLQCLQHYAECPHCGRWHKAGLTVATCGACMGKYLSNPYRKGFEFVRQAE
jgi:hypothetical protein